LVDKLRALGAEPLVMPSIAIVPETDTGALDTAIREHGRFDWIIFTSVNAVHIFCERVLALGLAPSSLAGHRLAAIGPQTAAALAEVGLQPEFVPETYVAE